MKGKLVRLVTISLIVLLAGSIAYSGTIKLALCSPFTGLGSILGDYIKKGALLAVDEINLTGGINGNKIELLIYDTAANPSTAMNVIRRAIYNDKVIAIFGPNMSSAVLGVHKLAQQARIPMLVGGTSPSYRYTKVHNPYLFRLRADDDVKTSTLVRYAVEVLGIKKPGIIYGSTDYCSAALKVAEREFEKYGVKIAAEEQIHEGDKDATGQLLKLKSAGFDGLIGLTHEPEAAVVVKQFRQLHLNVPIIGFSAWGVPAFTDLAGDAAIGVYSVQGFNPNDPEEYVRSFVAHYKARWGEKPSDPAQAYYDGIYFLAKAIEIAGTTNGTVLAKVLADKIETYGVQGKLKCDKYHNLTSVCYIARFDGKVWNIISKLY